MKINTSQDEDTITELLLSSSPAQEDKTTISSKQTYLKWIGIILLCIFPFGKSWASDNPSALQTNLIAIMDINSEQYNWFYTIYSIPNYILPLFSGYLVDRLGLKFGILFFGFVVMLGQFIFWLGCILPSYDVALIGRFIFGAGGETYLLVKYCMVAQWVDNHEFGFANGATFLTMRLGSTFNSMVTPKIYQATQSLGWATFVGLLLCIFCWACGIAWLFLGKIYKTKTRIIQEGQLPEERTQQAQKPNLKEILKFKKFSWLFCLLSVIFLSVYTGFTANGNSFLQKQYGFSQTQAGDVLSPLYVVAGVFTLIFGKVVDMIGKKLHFIVLGFVFEAFALFLFLILPHCSQCYIGLIPLACIGLGSALFSAAYWPAVGLLEKKEHLGMLMGIYTIAYNIGEGVYPAIVGMIEDDTTYKDNGYYYVLIFLGISALVGLVSAIIVEIWNKKENKGLNEKIKVGK